METLDTRLNCGQLKARFGGVSNMWIDRRLREAVDPLPTPIYIAGRRYWRLSEIQAWEARRAAVPRRNPKAAEHLVAIRQKALEAKAAQAAARKAAAETDEQTAEA